MALRARRCFDCCSAELVFKFPMTCVLTSAIRHKRACKTRVPACHVFLGERRVTTDDRGSRSSQKMVAERLCDSRNEIIFLPTSIKSLIIYLHLVPLLSNQYFGLNGNVAIIVPTSACNPNNLYSHLIITKKLSGSPICLNP